MADNAPPEDVGELYRRVFPMIREKCRRMLNDRADAEDVAQETFVRLWRSRRQIRDRRAMVGWVYRTATRLSIDRLRARGRSPLSESQEVVDPRCSFESRLAASETLAHVVRATPRRELEAVVYSGVDGMTHAEIAEVLGVSERTVRRLLSRFAQRQRRWRRG